MPDNGFGSRFSLVILAIGFAWGSFLANSTQLAAQTAQQMGVGTSPKFHTPSVPPPAGQDPWGPAKALGIAGNVKLKAAGLPTLDDATYLKTEDEYKKIFTAYGIRGSPAGTGRGTPRSGPASPAAGRDRDPRRRAAA